MLALTWTPRSPVQQAGPPILATMPPFLPLPAQLAVSRGHDLSVNMHVDDATKGGLGGWRNTLLFSPLQQYSGCAHGRWAT